MMKRGVEAEIAIIGGSGLYDQDLLKESREVKVYTPYGETSDLITVGEYEGRRIAFLPRHGRGHRIPPHNVNFRANIWALRELGVKRILASNACGSLREDLKPGDFVIIDQFIDRTKVRPSSFYEGGRVCHIGMADPFCPELRRLLIEGCRELSIAARERGTYVCIEGPRFSTRAESAMHRQWGADVVGMTVVPECVLAREAEICYASISTVTDYDVWKVGREVSIEEVVEILRRNVDKAKRLIARVIPQIPSERNCICSSALKDAVI